jgi:hypothetical protein
MTIFSGQFAEQHKKIALEKVYFFMLCKIFKSEIYQKSKPKIVGIFLFFCYLCVALYLINTLR